MIVRLLLCAALWVATSPAAAAGFQSASVPDPGKPSIDIGIWYPAEAPEATRADNPFGQNLALGSAVAGDHLPLVIVSHGKGGWLGGHADTALALAEAGFIVVALTHPGDNRDDESSTASQWMIDRPRHIARVLDYMLGSWSGTDRVDPSRIGIFGFSAGAYTALVSIGGVPDLRAAAAHCAAVPRELACRLGLASDFERIGLSNVPPTAWVHDARIKAAVLAAPGGGFAFAGTALAGVTVPVQLWAAAQDANVPNAANAEVVRRALPRPPELHIVDGAGHFAFLQSCNPRLQAAAPDLWAVVCVDAPGFNRAEFHRLFNASIVQFFYRQLGKP